MNRLTGRARTDRLPVVALVPGDSPRLAGEDAEHTRLMAESEEELPPILVHQRTMRVIDGMHRFRAALLRGDEYVEVEYFDGTEAEAFIVAVRANIRHGLPLTLVDREAAAARIIASHPHQSDRSVAAITGLAARTIGAIRRRTVAPGDQVTARIGRDGRVRPLSSAEARRVASEVIAKRPEASLREVARVAGISPATVRDVRERMRRGDDPVPARQRDGYRRPEPEWQPAPPDPGRVVERLPVRGREVLLRNLARDPSLRFSESGRVLLRWLLTRASGPEGWEKMVGLIPAHCAYLVAEMARGCAQEWTAFADRLERRLRNTA